MACKAALFEDADSFRMILQCTSPSAAKQAGRQVMNFSETKWQNHVARIAGLVLLAKFSGCPASARALQQTGTTILAETSPHDRVWGIGMHAHDPRAKNPAAWSDQSCNLLGQVLMEVREVLYGNRGAPLAAALPPPSISPPREYEPVGDQQEAGPPWITREPRLPHGEGYALPNQEPGQGRRDNTQQRAVSRAASRAAGSLSQLAQGRSRSPAAQGHSVSTKYSSPFGPSGLGGRPPSTDATAARHDLVTSARSGAIRLDIDRSEYD